MKTPANIIATLAKTDGRLDKEAIIRAEAVANNTEFFAGLRLAYDPMVTFGVKQVPSHSGPDGQGLPWAAFAKLADQLQKRELTGHDAKRAIELALTVATQDEWNGWYRLILIKDMKAGFSEGTVNRVCESDYKQFVIPVFECQLAKDCVDDEGNVDEAELKGEKQIDVKLDGMRVLTVVYPDGRVLQTSRNGKELTNFEVICKQISSIAGQFVDPIVLDGEVMSASFQDLMKQARRKTDVQADDSVLNLFDIIPLKEFLAGKSKLKQKDRTAQLQALFDLVGSALPNVTVVGTETVNLSTAEGRARLKEINAAALAGKYEGIMLKDPEALYECRRSKNWLKQKPFLTIDLKIVDVEEGKPDSKFVGTMGAVVCEGVDRDRSIRVNVGSGFSIQQRAQIWADITNTPVTWQKKVRGKWSKVTEQPTKQSVIGRVCEVKADAITKSEDNDHYSLRFPRFIRFRDDK